MSDQAAWVAQAQLLLANPQAVLVDDLNRLEKMLDGQYDLSTPNTPFMHLKEANIVHCAAFFKEMGVTLAKQYPSLAQTQEDLYLHMSDADYAGRFAQPAMSTFTFMFDRDEVLRAAVPVGSTGTYKLVIPRHTAVTVGGVTFTLQYPIEIRVAAHGAINVVYDTSEPSPLQALQSNMIEPEWVNWQGVLWLRLRVPMYQFEITSHSYALNLSQRSVKQFTFSDQFHYARAYHTDANGSWKEIKTTHSDQTYDVSVPTVQLKVVDQILTVTVPTIYQTTRQLTNELRIDIYTTHGPMQMIMSDYAINQFQAKFKDSSYADTSQLPYSKPLRELSTLTIFNDQTVSGGENAMTFETLRARVISNSLGKANVPITNINIGSRLADMGFDMVTDVDHVTNRQMLATRLLPNPGDGTTISGAGSTMLTLTESMENLAKLDTVKDNGDRITITPDTVYQSTNGILSIVPKAVVDSLLATQVDVRARRLNDATYLYSPFHYVLDMTGSVFEHRPYYFENPSVNAKSFVGENVTMPFSVSVKSHKVDRVPEGYVVTCVLTSGQSFKDLDDDQIFVQMSFLPAGETVRAYQNGTLVGYVGADGAEERVYTFLIATDFDVDAKDNLIVNSFQMLEDPVHKYPCPLTNSFDVHFAVNQIEIEGYQKAAVDDALGRALLPNDVKAISQDRLEITLGSSLKGLWSSSRSVASAQDYKRYVADVPAVWEQTVYKRDANGEIEVVFVNGNPTFVVLHEKGDPVLDDQGNQVIAHYAGDIEHDIEGNPIIIGSRRLLRQMDMFLIDGIYWFATEFNSSEYRDRLPTLIDSWLKNDIAQVQSELLEQTTLFFYPKSTLGNINVKVLENKTVALNSAQSFNVTFHLSGAAFRDLELRATLEATALEVIHDMLQNAVVSMSDITRELRERVQGDTVGVSITGLGGSTPYDVITLIDDSARLSIRKKAVARADGTLAVEDDVAFVWLQHTAS